MKSVFESKTAALALVTTVTGIVANFVPSVGEWVSANTELILSTLGVASFVLRLVTREKVTLLPNK